VRERCLWPGCRANAVHDLVGIRIVEDLEQFLAGFRVVDQRAIGISKSIASMT
jgi:hypothetical protein